PLTAWCTLRIWGRIPWALASGLFMALYAPALMYESVILKESIFLFFALLSLAVVLKAHKSQFSPVALFFCGIFLALVVTHRISALPFCGLASLWIIACLFKKLKKDKKKTSLRISFLALGLSLILIPFFIASIGLLSPNSTYRQYLTKYIFSSHSSPTSMSVVDKAPIENAKNTNNTKDNKILYLLRNMFKRAPLVFSASETPNNINYYFLKHKLFPLQYLISPLLLIPLAATALILLLFNRGFLSKESILFIFIFSYMIPIIIFIPLARYRLVLIPVFCMLAPYPFFAVWKAWHKKNLFSVLLPIVTYALILYINLPLNSFVRSTDLVSYGKGMQFKTGKSASGMSYFIKAYKMAPYKQMTVVNLADTLLKNRHPDKAVAILLAALQKSPDNLAYRYYLGMAYFFSGKAKQAEQLFSKINPDAMGNLKTNYYYFYEHSLRMQKKYKAAAKLHQKALKDSSGQ
ncbi:MAG: tetratricopeptide repeat protein, partial [Victivallales bacterium]|nr:tetratricopeptide repeat protein [Victivallales bacterium]